MEAPANDELHRRRERPLHQLICREAKYLPRRMPQQHGLADREGLMVCWLSQDWPMGAMGTSWHTDHVILADTQKAYTHSIPNIAALHMRYERKLSLHICTLPSSTNL